MDNVNNFKGLMLCNRPNEIIRFLREKPFCARVDAKNQLGLQPAKDQEQQKIWTTQSKKQVNEVLKRHKDWLQLFKMKQKLKKEQQEEETKVQEEKYQKVKEIAQKKIERTKKMKEEFQKLNESILMELEQNKDKQQNKKDGEDNKQNIKKQEESKELQSDSIKKNKKKGEKPKWAYTQDQFEEEQEKDVDDLLDFVDNLDYDKYIDDLEVQTMIKTIQNRVDDIKKQENWKDNLSKQYEKEKQEANKKRKEEGEDDYITQFSDVSQTKSVASERTQQSIQSLKSQLEDKKKGKTEWETLTQQEKKGASIEEKIAKLMADDILRNYKNLQNVHSNSSIRKLLEREAKKSLELKKGNLYKNLFSNFNKITLEEKQNKTQK